MGFHNNVIWTPDHFVALVYVTDPLDFNKSVHVEEPEGINLTNITGSVTNEDIISSHSICKTSTPVRPPSGNTVVEKETYNVTSEDLNLAHSTKTRSSVRPQSVNTEAACDISDIEAQHSVKNIKDSVHENEMYPLENCKLMYPAEILNIISGIIPPVEKVSLGKKETCI